MSRYALIQGGTVVNVVLWDGDRETWEPDENTIAVEAPDAVSIGWTYGAGGFAAPPPPALSFAEAQAQKLAALSSAFDAAIAGGAPYAGKVVQIRDKDRAAIAEKGMLALGVVMSANSLTWPAAFAWRMADNSSLPLTATEMLDLAQAAQDRYGALWSHLVALKDQIAAAAAAEDRAALDAVDVTAGWD